MTSSGWAAAIRARTLRRHCLSQEPVFVPVRLFTDAERERLNRFPRDVSPADLLPFFTLSDEELELIDDRRGDHNRLGFGLQLKTLPYLGFVPDDLSSAPARVVSYLTAAPACGGTELFTPVAPAARGHHPE